VVRVLNQVHQGTEEFVLMTRWLLLPLIIALELITGCASYNVGGSEFAHQRSYEGTTLNSPVADQNPHSGGDPSYPSSVSDEGRTPQPLDRSAQ
jgi:hypothetical protein